MCIIIHMNNDQDYLVLRDAANALEYGSLKSDARIQVKIPSNILTQLDKAYPDIDRSKVITKAILDLLLTKFRNSDPSLEHWQNDEQYDMDRMWNYLEERDSK